MLAILYDIHGNRPALEAVLADARERGADRWLLGGDYCAFGAWPVECVEILRALGDDATWIRGNWERWSVEPGAAPDTELVQGAATAVRAALGPGALQELGGLPNRAVIDDTLFVHASPVSDIDAFSPQADAESDDQLLAGVAQGRVVAGHSHVQFARHSARGVQIVNPGSVGLPWDGDPRAAYATIDDGGLALRRVEYDVDAAVAAVAALGAPWALATAEWLRSAARF